VSLNGFERSRGYAQRVTDKKDIGRLKGHKGASKTKKDNGGSENYRDEGHNRLPLAFKSQSLSQSTKIFSHPQGEPCLFLSSPLHIPYLYLFSQVLIPS